MAWRALKVFGTGLAYIVAGIPALIGIGFVARYAYITSDTPLDGAATAFLFGMVAAGAFAGPAIAVAVSNRGRKLASRIWWILATLAIIANWSHTLSAIAHRGAGLDASHAKITTDTAADRRALARLERELAALPPFVPTTSEAVSASQAAVDLAKRNRELECGANNETRGSRCREREADERAKQDALTRALENKAATDRASRLEVLAAAVRQRLADAPPAPLEHALGRTLGRFLPVSAAAAATLQQMFVSAIVELLIAAVLALPEVLRSPRKAGAAREAHDGLDTPKDPMPEAVVLAPIAEPKSAKRAAAESVSLVRIPAIAAPISPPSDSSEEIDPKPVVTFLAAYMPADRGGLADWGEIYGGFLAWQKGQGGEALSASQFGAVLRHICEQADIRVRRQGDRVYCLDRRITWKS